jgi:hypothetical protein
VTTSSPARCHLCPHAAVEQCRYCWKFYCANHGGSEDIAKTSIQPTPNLTRLAEVESILQGFAELQARQLQQKVGRRARSCCEQCGAKAAGVTPGVVWLLMGGQPRNADSPPGTPLRMPFMIKAETLRRVVPIDAAKTCGMNHLRLTSLELYEDGLILKYEMKARRGRHRQPGAHLMPSLSMNNMPFTATDDLGGTYAGHMGGGGTPSVDVQATRLTLRVESILWDIGGGFGGPQGKLFVEAGPWVFEVAL